eukprot:Gb_13060 [translate_table: standard]
MVKLLHHLQFSPNEGHKSPLWKDTCNRISNHGIGFSSVEVDVRIRSLVWKVYALLELDKDKSLLVMRYGSPFYIVFRGGTGRSRPFHGRGRGRYIGIDIKNVQVFGGDLALDQERGWGTESRSMPWRKEILEEQEIGQYTNIQEIEGSDPSPYGSVTKDDRECQQKSKKMLEDLAWLEGILTRRQDQASISYMTIPLDVLVLATTP